MTLSDEHLVVSCSCSFFDKVLELLQQVDVLGLLVGRAVVGEGLRKGLVDSPLLQHVHEEVVQVTEKKNKKSLT